MTPETLEDDAKSQMKHVKAAGHKDIRWCGAYKVSALSDSSMNLRFNRSVSIPELDFVLRSSMKREIVYD